MRADFARVAAFGGNTDLQAQAWQRFMQAWAQDNPTSTQDEQLRSQAQDKLAQAQRAAQGAVVAPAQPVIASADRTGQVVTDCAICPPVVAIPAGFFQMGSADGNGSEKPVRTVKMPAFWMGRTEVTQGQWKAVLGTNPSQFQQCGDDCPVEGVSWDDAQAFVSKLNSQTGRRYRLPSEAEWEYAARAGSTTQFHTGETITTDQANFDGNYTYNGSSRGTARHRTMRVGSFSANAFGLHDMHGNVWEWVQDVWHVNYIDAPADGSVWAFGDDQARRVLRGGSWLIDPRYLRSAYRNMNSREHRSGDVGFRIVRTD